MLVKLVTDIPRRGRVYPGPHNCKDLSAKRAGINPAPTYLFVILFLLFSNLVHADTAQRTQTNKLLREASELFANQHPIDARSKLLKALKEDPDDYRIHLYLGEYYLQNVGHFQLAFRYIEKADELFKKHKSTYPKNLHLGSEVAILALKSSAELNLDKYEESLETLEKLEKLNWNPNIPGTKAWILWKLGKLDEAIKVAQAGIAKGAEPTRIFNMLGILLSSKGNRRLSLGAFAKAIQAEVLITGSKTIATPLNNAGEVYREMFMDRYAESSWRQAILMPDGCEHVLPSLNLAILLLDELRLFNAERSLSDFEICYKENAERLDNEHKTLLALHRGKLALHSGDPEKAYELIKKSIERRQWFGNIGTNENDMRIASYVSMADVIEAKIVSINDRAYENISSSLLAKAEIPWLKLQTWWYKRRAREIAIDELSDFEDLYIRHTDSMLTYPTLGSAVSGYALASIKKRVKRIKKDDSRAPAHNYYDTYLAEALYQNGKSTEAKKLFQKVISNARSFERLLKARALAFLIKIEEAKWGQKKEDKEQIREMKKELYRLHPAYLRYFDLKMPITIKASKNSKVAKHLLKTRFEISDSPYELIVNESDDKLSAVFKMQEQNIFIEEKISKTEKNAKENLINNFIAKVFSHRVDHPGEPLPKLPILQGVT